jgi:hypothetical protein
MSSMHQPAESPYEAALAEERVKWKRLDLPQPDVNEQLKACAEWTAAAERARAVARRMQETGVASPSR